jgi:hypothetical protein
MDQTLARTRYNIRAALLMFVSSERRMRALYFAGRDMSVGVYLEVVDWPAQTMPACSVDIHPSLPDFNRNLDRHFRTAAAYQQQPVPTTRIVCC